MRCLALMAVVVSGFGFATSHGQDVIVLKSGQYTACEIEALTDNILTFTLIQQGGNQGGVARRTISTSEVAYVEFDFEPGEEEAFAAKETLDMESVEAWWNHHFAHLHRPRSRTGAWGIALGYALLDKDVDLYGSRALQLFDRIAERAWSEIDVAAAKRGRLHALMRLGELERAITEANILAGQTEDPELLIEVKHLLAEADFARLRELEEEHPRWDEDDEVRPERNELYHSIIDQFMWPYLFHAAREEAAARGLFGAGLVYEFGGEAGLATNAYRDLIALYPESEARTKADRRLEGLANKDFKENSDKPELSNP